MIEPLGFSGAIGRFGRSVGSESGRSTDGSVVDSARLAEPSRLIGLEQKRGPCVLATFARRLTDRLGRPSGSMQSVVSAKVG